MSPLSLDNLFLFYDAHITHFTTTLDSKVATELEKEEKESKNKYIT